MVDLVAETLLVAAASLGIWRLLAVDTILEPVRARLPIGVQHWVACGWCGGFWVTALVAVSWAAVQDRLGWDTVVVAAAARWIVGTVAARTE